MVIHYRKSPRLERFEYAGSYVYFLTLVTRRRRHVFTQAPVVNRVVAALQLSADKHGFEIHAYCFMPDHLHLLVSGEPSSSLREFVRHFKQRSSFEFKKRLGSELWQISYYDRVLRSDEDLPSVARYIWGNPVAPGLVVDGRHYPFSGPQPLTDIT